jgi:3-phosphoshikimate 1-carboxyvinyltransferase
VTEASRAAAPAAAATGPDAVARAPRAWPAVLTIEAIGQARGEIRLPGSKSMSNRALLLAALAQGSTELSGLLEADDTRVMVAALRALGIVIEREGDRARVSGCGGRFPARAAELHLGNAGTAMRSLTAALAFAGGSYRLDGVARMRERPIGDLVEALNAMGACIGYLGAAGYPPLLIDPAVPAAGAADNAAVPVVRVRGDVSSQFLSGLLMAAPLLLPAQGLDVLVDGVLISQPYVAMTAAMMRAFGASIDGSGNRYHVAPGGYRSPGHYAIEGDASGASYFLALGAIAGGPVRVRGVGRDSLQGDLAFTDVLKAMGAQVEVGSDWVQVQAPAAGLRAIEIDATAIPDAAMTAAVLALFADGTTRINGIASWRVKETDRIAAMAAEIGKLGAAVQSGPDWIAVTAPPRLWEAWIDTYDDHRMAMCLALAAARGVRVHIRDPQCVSKTFPDFFDELERLRVTANR